MRKSLFVPLLLLAACGDGAADEAAKQKAETLIASIEGLFDEVERAVGGADFGRDAVEKGKRAIASARKAIASRDGSSVSDQVLLLERTDKMFRGVLSSS